MDFDFCRYGMASPVHAYPIKKRTKLMTSMGPVASRFKNAFCKCVTKYPLKGGLYKHLAVEGREEGIQVSSHCQKYPRACCKAVAQCVHAYVVGRPS